MRLLIIIVCFAFFSAPVNPGPKEDVHETITSQLQAFLEDDFEKAFTYASPSIRSMFRSPENFGRMVRTGYPMVWRYQEVTFLEHRKDSRGRIQDIQILDQKGKVHYLRYFLTDTSSGWKISGVEFLDPADYSA